MTDDSLTPQEIADLKTTAATALLSAIRDASATANNRSSEGLESLARAYNLVVESMPKQNTGKGRGVTVLS